MGGLSTHAVGVSPLTLERRGRLANGREDVSGNSTDVTPVVVKMPVKFSPGAVA
jgi:hypothetical protein